MVFKSNVQVENLIIALTGNWCFIFQGGGMENERKLKHSVLLFSSNSVTEKPNHFDTSEDRF